MGLGKLEIIQFYIFFLVVNFYLYDVVFFFIDYKGGGMVNFFKDLLYLFGIIINLDGV